MALTLGSHILRWCHPLSNIACVDVQWLSGVCVRSYQADETPLSTYVNTHGLLEQRRRAAKAAGKRGPRTFVSPPDLAWLRGQEASPMFSATTARTGACFNFRASLVACL